MREPSDIRALLERLPTWAASHQDVHAIALVGSSAGGQARTDSDVDVVILTDSPDRYLKDRQWTVALGLDPIFQEQA